MVSVIKLYYTINNIMTAFTQVKDVEGVDNIYLLKDRKKYDSFVGKVGKVNKINFKGDDGHNYEGSYLNKNEYSEDLDKNSFKIYKKSDVGMVSDTIRIGTLNVGGIKLSYNMLNKLMDRHDILLLQEVNIEQFTDKRFNFECKGLKQLNPNGVEDGTMLFVLYNKNTFEYITNENPTYMNTSSYGVRTSEWIILNHIWLKKIIAVISVHIPIGEKQNKRKNAILNSIFNDTYEAYYTFIGGDFNIPCSNQNPDVPEFDKFFYINSKQKELKNVKKTGSKLFLINNARFNVQKPYFEEIKPKKPYAVGELMSSILKKYNLNKKTVPCNETHFSLKDVYYNKVSPKRYRHDYAKKIYITYDTSDSKRIPIEPFIHRLDYIFSKGSVQLLSEDFGDEELNLYKTTTDAIKQFEKSIGEKGTGIKSLNELKKNTHDHLIVSHTYRLL